MYKRHTMLKGVLQILEADSAEPADAAYTTDAFIDGASARAAMPLAEETTQAMTPGNLLPGCVSTVSTGASSANTRTAGRAVGPVSAAAAGSASRPPATPPVVGSVG